MMRSTGFTLAELLIALALLGVIATFAIPLVLTAIQEQQKKTAFRETLFALMQVQQYGMKDPAFTPDTIGSYFITHLNTLHSCLNNALTEGCTTPAMTSSLALGAPMNMANQPGLVLAGGAIVASMDNAAYATSYATTYFGQPEQPNAYWWNRFVIDWNGPAGPNQIGQDELLASICFGQFPCKPFPKTAIACNSIVDPLNAINPQPSGTILPVNDKNSCDMLGDPIIQANYQLYNWIMQ